MKQLYALVAALVLSCTATLSVSAQNVQLHYDLGRSIYSKDLLSRPTLTTTIEHFRPDSWGSTFYFVDMNYQDNGVQSAYWEIARDIRLWKAPISLHLEYNGGLSNRFSYNDAYLLGASYAYNSEDFSWGYSLTPMYKYLAGYSNPHSWQLTATWYLHLANKLMTVTGFADVWGDRVWEDKVSLVFLGEPQLWLNLNKLRGVSPHFNLSIGTEMEMSYNFNGKDKFYVIPTLALKWTF